MYFVQLFDVVWSTNLTLPLAGPDATQPTLHVLSSTIVNTLNTINESSFEYAVSLCSALHILLPFVLSIIYQTQYFQHVL